ncbi:hypothetical protein JCM19238_1572 [Vibrio ponticus]|nr:hypothetical protein JCM19238_1572 [Vibrio ponticus]
MTKRTFKYSIIATSLLIAIPSIAEQTTDETYWITHVIGRKIA